MFCDLCDVLNTYSAGSEKEVDYFCTVGLTHDTRQRRHVDRDTFVLLLLDLPLTKIGEIY